MVSSQKKKRGRYKLAATSTDIWANESPGTATRLPKEVEKLQITQNFGNQVPHDAHAVMRGTEHTKTEKVGGNYFYDKPSTQRYFKKKKKLERGREELERKKNTHSAWVRLLATLLQKSNLIRKGTARIEKKEHTARTHTITGQVTRTLPRAKNAFGHSGKREQSSPSPPD